MAIAYDGILWITDLTKVVLLLLLPTLELHLPSTLLAARALSSPTSQNSSLDSDLGRDDSRGNEFSHGILPCLTIGQAIFLYSHHNSWRI